jgi:hypothetical protein
LINSSSRNGESSSKSAAVPVCGRLGILPTYKTEPNLSAPKQNLDFFTRRE